MYRSGMLSRLAVGRVAEYRCGTDHIGFAASGAGVDVSDDVVDD